MSKELASINRRVERLRNILKRATKIHKVLTEFSDFQSDVKHGEFLANEHRMVMDAYGDFFATTKDSLYLDLHLQVAKVLIDHEGALHIPKLIRQFVAEGQKIARQAARDSNFEESISEFGTWYELLPQEELDDLTYMLENKRDLTKRLEYARNKQLAHEDLTELSVELLTLRELMDSMDLAESIIKKIESTYGGFNDIDRYRLDRFSRDTHAVLEKLYKDY